jgi:hypothetical protein
MTSFCEKNCSDYDPLRPGLFDPSGGHDSLPIRL